MKTILKFAALVSLALTTFVASAAFDSGFPGPAPSVMELPTPNVKILGAFGVKNVPFSVATNAYGWFTNCTFQVPYNQDIRLWFTGKSADTKATGSYWFFLNIGYGATTTTFTTRILNPQVVTSMVSFGTNTTFTASALIDKTNFSGASWAQVYLMTNASGTVNGSNLVVTANVP